MKQDLQKKNLPNLPSTSDWEEEIGETSDINTVDMDKQKDVLCGDLGSHDYQISFEKREINCNKCGFGFAFHTHLVKEEEGFLVVETKSGSLRIPIKE